MKKQGLEVLLLALALLISQGEAAEELAVTLASPLTQRVVLKSVLPVGACTLTCEVHTPETAPSDIGLGIYGRDRVGRWRQACLDRPLTVGGTTTVRLRLPASGVSTAAGELMDGEFGLQIWASGSSRAIVRLRNLHIELEKSDVIVPRLLDVAWSSTVPWTFTARPSPVPTALAAGWSMTGALSDAAAHRRTLYHRDVPPGPGRPSGAWSLTVLPETPGEHQLAITTTVAGTPLATLTKIPIAGATTSPSTAPRLTLQSPLTSEFVIAASPGLQARRIVARLRISDDVPIDLAATGFLQDGDGRWRLDGTPQALAPGLVTLSFTIPSRRRPLPDGPAQAGIALSSGKPGAGTVWIEHLEVTDLLPSTASDRLGEVTLDGWDRAGKRALGAIGTPWKASVRPLEYHPRSLRCHVTAPDKRTWNVALQQRDDGSWNLTLHPIMIGTHTLRLIATGDSGERSVPLPPLIVNDGVMAEAGTRVRLASPLVTRITGTVSAGASRLHAIVVIADDAPRDIGIAAWVSDRHGRWYQTTPQGPLAPGTHRLSWAIDGSANLQALGHGARWSPAEAAKVASGGLVVWSTQRSSSAIVVAGLHTDTVATPIASAPQLTDLVLDGWDVQTSTCTGTTGERWEMAVRPLPFPSNPFDDGEFALDAVIREPDGSERRIAGFFAQDMQRSSRGDKELLTPVANGCFRVRFRPRQSGEHRIRLTARWAGKPELTMTLPSVHVSGAAWDAYVRVDATDPRFFSVAGTWFWPLGPNLRSVWDVRSRDRMKTKLTPDHGTLAYDAYLDRFAAAGANACEIWLSSWNLALEWRNDWPGFHGTGRFNEENAWRIDAILDRAWRNRIRVNLVINNHGQASVHADAEWTNNPWSTARGGPLDDPRQLFTDPRALAGQERVRRYLVARYADHPAIMGWKLWSEQDLTEGKDALPAWHQQAVARWHALDSYRHPVTSHWCGNFTHAKPEVVQHLDYVCIDAYHGWGDNDRYRAIADLLRDSTLDAARGLGRFAKPGLVTEFGGNWDGAPSNDLMASDHAVGPWVAVMTGHAGAPMLWWFEWIDQGERWGPYRALSAFLAHEDLRGAATSTVLAVENIDQCQCIAWARPGRVLGHLLDRSWSSVGGAGSDVADALIVVGDDIAAGAMRVEWWNADTGAIVAEDELLHPGGRLVLASPLFQRHLAFKLVRTD